MASTTGDKPAAKKTITKKPVIKKSVAKKSVIKKPATSKATSADSKPNTTKKAPAKKVSAKKISATASTKIGAAERYRMVETAAYFIAERNGFSGNSTDYWIAAEAQIKRMLAK